jgi:hypothetical protein
MHCPQVLADIVCAVVCCAQGPAGYKADRDAQRKRDAGNRSAWSTLFMRADTVAAAVAAHYGVSKSQLLDASAEDLPLRMALGEAQVSDAGSVCVGMFGPGTLPLGLGVRHPGWSSVQHRGGGTGQPACRQCAARRQQCTLPSL